MRIRFLHKVSIIACLALGILSSTALATPLKDISWQELERVQVGNAQDAVKQTGVTVIYFPKTALAGVDISGGGPCISRNTGFVTLDKSYPA